MPFFSNSWFLWLLLTVLPACSTPLSKTDAEFLSSQPTLRVVHVKTPALVVIREVGTGSKTTASLSVGAIDHPDTPRQVASQFVIRLASLLREAKIVIEDAPVYAPTFPHDIVLRFKTGMTLAFKVKASGMTIWPEYGFNWSGPTHMRDYKARLKMVAALVYPEADRTLWEDTCQVQTSGDLPDMSIQGLLEKDSPSFNTIMKNLIKQCSDELWGKFHAGFATVVPSEQLAASRFTTAH